MAMQSYYRKNPVNLDLDKQIIITCQNEVSTDIH
jgi:hypothetical protein